MATVIDSLLVSLKLDSSQFTKGQQDAIKSLKDMEKQSGKTGQHLTKHGKESSEAWGALKREVMGAVVAFAGLGAMKAFAVETTKADQSTGRLAIRLGMAVEELTAWEGVAKKFGSSKEGIDSAFTAIQKLSAQYRTGTLPNDIVQALGFMHVNIEKMLNVATPAEEKIKLIQTALAGLSEQGAQVLGQRLGFDATTISMLREAASNMDALLGKQREMNVLTGEDLQLSLKRGQAWFDLGENIKRPAHDLLNSSTPAIVVVAKSIEALLGWAKKADQKLQPAEPREKSKIDEWVKKWFSELIGLNDSPTSNISKKSQELGDLIGRGEGGVNGYNSVNRGKAGGYAAGTENLESMTVAQVMQAQAAQQFNAAGKYQVTAPVLIEAVKSLGLTGNEQFNAQTQDKIFEQFLIGTKRKEVQEYLNGGTNLKAALIGLAQEFASVTDPGTGKSRYDGVGGNVASISTEELTKVLQGVRAAHLAQSNTTVNVGSLNVSTRADNPKAVATEVNAQLKSLAFSNSANSGLQ